MKFLSYFLVAAVTCKFGVSNPVSYYKQLNADEVKRLLSWKPDSKQSMWQLSGQYQGDIVLTPMQKNGVINTNLRWPNNEIPYELSSDFTEQEKQFIISSLESQYSKTCITPRPRRSTDTDYVYVTGQNTGCWSYVGRLRGRQELNLQRNGCLIVGTVVHEFLHALGFYHQQSATDRDDWVNIYWQNIIPGYEYAFDKFGTNVISSFGQNYDYDSVMHYGEYAFSSNNQPTILPKDPNAQIGQSRGLSAVDIIKLNKMYNCA